MSSNTEKQWRVQTKTVHGRWQDRGLFETRSAARQKAKWLRDGWGFGNTRVVRYKKSVK